MSLKVVAAIALSTAACLAADEPQLKQRAPLPQNGVTEYRIEQGKRIPVKLLNTISIRTGDQDGRVYLQTVFPVVVSDHAVIPSGAYIDAKLIELRRTARGKGRAELYIRLERLSLPNGRQRLLDSCHGSMTAATATHGADVVIVPGTTADIVLQDPIVFPVEPVSNR